MSLLNGFNGQQAGRSTARPADEPAPNAPVQLAWPQSAPPAQQPSRYGVQAGYASPQAPQYPHSPQQAAQAGGYDTLSAQSDPYAANFEPYAPAPQRPQPAQQPQQQYAPAQQGNAQGLPQAATPYGAFNQQGFGDVSRGADPYAQQRYQQQQAQPQQNSSQWGQSQAANQRSLEIGNYLQQPTSQGQSAHRAAPEPRFQEPDASQWPQAQGYDFGDAQGHPAQSAANEADQGYVEEDGQEYEVEEPSRSRRFMTIAAALAGAIIVGGGVSYGYKSFLGGGATDKPPMVKSASEPSKIKPADAGGKQFAHTDSKIMGRLGDGASPAAGPDSTPSSDADASGTRKVSTLVVGRDGSIQAPAAAPIEAAPAVPSTAPIAASAGVPGMTIVDGFANKGKPATAAPVAAAVEAAPVAPQKLVINPPAAAPQKLASLAKAPVSEPPKPLAESTGSIEPAVAAPVAPKKVVAKKVAAAAPTIANDAGAAPAAPVTAGGANGYVAVLASVPRSATSRMDALKRFADMQQKYGNALGGKTPDVAEANLGAKGAYHRLVVGPPGSREQASSLCSQLKTQGYTDCWVTSY